MELYVENGVSLLKHFSSVGRIPLLKRSLPLGVVEFFSRKEYFGCAYNMQRFRASKLLIYYIVR